MSSLPSSPTTPGSGLLIERDVECEQCGYSLRGLYTHSACPECGTFIRDKAAGGTDVRFTSTLVDAPLGYLKRLVLGTASTAVVGVAMTFGQLYLWANSFPGREVVQAVSPVLWIAAVFLVTTPRPRTPDTPPDMMLDRAWFRWLVIVMQATWPLGVAVLVAPAVLGTLGVTLPAWGTSTSMIAGSFLVFVAAIGLAPLCLYLAALADWAQAAGVADRLRTAAFFTGVFGVLTVMLALSSMANGFLLAPVAGVLSIISGVLAIVGVGMLVFSMIQLAFLAAWAVRNWHDIQQRDERVEMRRRARDAEVAARVARIAEAQARQPVRVMPVGNVGMNEHRLERAPRPPAGDGAGEDGAPIAVDGMSDGHDELARELLGDKTPVRRFGSEYVRERDDDATPYGLEPEEHDGRR